MLSRDFFVSICGGVILLRNTLGSKPRRKIYIACQGGGALSATTAAMISEVLAYDELLPVHWAGISGGGINAHEACVGWNKGLAEKGFGENGIALARRYARQNLTHLYVDLSGFQGMWYHTGFKHPMVAAAMRAGKNMTSPKGQALKKGPSPLIGFFAKRQQNPLEAQPQWREGFTSCVVAGTRIKNKCDSVWLVDPAEAERILPVIGKVPWVKEPHNPNLSDEERHLRLVISGNLEEHTPIEYQRGSATELLHDGAYSHGIPSPLEIAAYCAANDIDLVIPRSRPTNSILWTPSRPGDIPETIDEIRGALNTIMDSDIAEIRKAFPKLKVVVIETNRLEMQTDPIVPPEGCLDEQKIAQRWAAGQKAAAVAIEKAYGLSPLKNHIGETPEQIAHEMLQASVIAITDNAMQTIEGMRTVAAHMATAPARAAMAALMMTNSMFAAFEPPPRKGTRVSSSPDSPVEARRAVA